MANTSTQSVLNATDYNSTVNPPVLASGGLPPVLVVFFTLQQIVFALALVGNTIVILIFVKYLKLNTNMNIICVNMAVVDLIQGLGCGVQILYFFLRWLDNNKYTCLLKYTLISFPVTTSQKFMSLATFDRFLAVKFPFVYQKYMTRKVTWLIVITSYVISGGFNAPTFFFWNTWEDGIPCLYSLVFQRSYLLSSGLLVFLCMAISATLYQFVFITALRYHRRLKKNDNKSANSSVKRSIRGARFLGVSTIISTVAWAPFEFYQVCVGLGYTDIIPETSANFLVFFGIARCVTNPFIYIWHRKDFNTSLKKLFSWAETASTASKRSTRENSVFSY
ncbi:hypothetical protein FSP39_002110 [Pinctada imbricata]|uniref:G-protein coupled receptors family 1 profile domain-containing protein n=1 Tax=Pinctada imbricata TaxID=66713 RepID=A0AA88XHC0_PINIB|nr:hypothetical protein FSP39_002110 [Pinctada imbricata]